MERNRRSRSHEPLQWKEAANALRQAEGRKRSKTSYPAPSNSADVHRINASHSPTLASDFLTKAFTEADRTFYRNCYASMTVDERRVENRKLGASMQYDSAGEILSYAIHQRLLLLLEFPLEPQSDRHPSISPADSVSRPSSPQLPHQAEFNQLATDDRYSDSQHSPSFSAASSIKSLTEAEKVYYRKYYLSMTIEERRAENHSLGASMRYDSAGGILSYAVHQKLLLLLEFPLETQAERRPPICPPDSSVRPIIRSIPSSHHLPHQLEFNRLAADDEEIRVLQYRLEMGLDNSSEDEDAGALDSDNEEGLAADLADSEEENDDDEEPQPVQRQPIQRQSGRRNKWEDDYVWFNAAPPFNLTSIECSGPIDAIEPDRGHYSGSRIANKAEFTQLDAFLRLITPSMLDTIFLETNKYAFNLCHSPRPTYIPARWSWPPVFAQNWTTLTVAEFKAFIGLTLMMGVIRLQRFEHYWSSDPIYAVGSWIHVMSRDRFKQIRRCFHCCDNNAHRPEDPILHKMSDILQQFQRTIRSNWNSSRNVTGDEMIALCKSKFAASITFRRLPKPIPHGIKIFAICEAKTGVLLSFLVDQRDGVSTVQKMKSLQKN